MAPWWSLDWVRAVQGLGPWAVTPMRVVSFFGQEFLVLLIPLLYWSISKQAGIDLAVLMAGSSFVNMSLKAFFREARPFWLDPTLQRGSATSYSFPSGHAQSSATIFGGLAYFAVRSKRTRVTRILAVVMLALLILLIAFSRVYLGVHYPGDTLVGILAGFSVLALYVYLKPRVKPVLARLPLAAHAVFAVLAALAVLGIHWLGLLVKVTLPPQAGDLIAAAGVASTHETGSLAGIIAGVWLGLAVERQYVRFTVDGSQWQRALRYVLGGATTGLIFAVLHAISPAAPTALSGALLVIRYALVAFWAFALWPWVFVRLGWAGRMQDE